MMAFSKYLASFGGWFYEVWFLGSVVIEAGSWSFT
jgi:hypothetical protein